MPDLKLTQLDELEIAEQIEEPSEDSVPDVSETVLRPSQPLNFGTHIALLIEDSTVQMAAVAHLGHYRKILDIDKRFLTVEQLSSKEHLILINKAVMDFINQHRGPFSVVSLAISGKETVLRNFLLPMLKKKDLILAVEIEAKKQLPFPIEECSYDFRPISIVRSGARRLYNISLFAATRRLIGDKLERFGELKKHVEHIYHATDVVGRLLPHIAGFEEFGAYTTLNIGQIQSEIAFYRGSSLEFYNVINIGASMLGKKPDPVSYSFLAESLTSEIQTAIDFYTGRFNRIVSNKIFVYGDLVNSNDVIESIKTSSGYYFERFPIHKLRFVSSKNLSAFEAKIPVCLPTFAASLCPAGMSDVLPREAKQIHRTYRLNNYSKAVLITLFVILAGTWGLLNKAIGIKRSELVSLNSQVNDFVNSGAYTTYNALKRQIAIDEAYLKTAFEPPTFLSLNLKELSLRTPNEVQLVNMQFHPIDSGSNLVIEGIVYSKDIPPEIILAEFIENLADSPFYNDVEVNRHVKKEKKQGFEIDFSIRCRGLI